MARPTAVVVEVRQLVADVAGTISGPRMAVALNRVGGVQVAELTVHLMMMIDDVIAQAVGVIERGEILAVPAAKVAG